MLAVDDGEQIRVGVKEFFRNGYSVPAAASDQSHAVSDSGGAGAAIEKVARHPDFGGDVAMQEAGGHFAVAEGSRGSAV